MMVKYHQIAINDAEILSSVNVDSQQQNGSRGTINAALWGNIHILYHY